LHRAETLFLVFGDVIKTLDVVLKLSLVLQHDLLSQRNLFLLFRTGGLFRSLGVEAVGLGAALHFNILVAITDWALAARAFTLVELDRDQVFVLSFFVFFVTVRVRRASASWSSFIVRTGDGSLVFLHWVLFHVLLLLANVVFDVCYIVQFIFFHQNLWCGWWGSKLLRRLRLWAVHRSLALINIQVVNVVKFIFRLDLLLFLDLVYSLLHPLL
jgi:hypothetical protein